MKTIDLPPYAPTLIESTRAIGYSLEAAVADIIDNSIAASAKNVDIFFFPANGGYVAILDDGCGMDTEELNAAMQYGSKSPFEKRDAKDLGRFGLGLKTASLSQCRCLTVVTKQDNRIEGRRWDIDFVSETGSWSLLVLDEDELQSVPNIEELKAYSSGTIVVWQKLDRLSTGEIDFEQALGRKIDAVRDHLSLVFHRYLNGSIEDRDITTLKIMINRGVVHGADPFLEKKSTQAIDDEVLIIEGQKIKVRPYILPHKSRMSATELKDLGGDEGLRKHQGFYVYRNKRLLVWGTWFRMRRQEELSKLARIRVDIPNTLDELWTLDIKKSSAIPPAVVKKNLQGIIGKIAEKSKRTYVYRGKKEVSDTGIHVWDRLKMRDGGYSYRLNRKHPLMELFYTQFPDGKAKFEAILSQIENTLPLNQLYVDLSRDEKLTNEQMQHSSNVINYLKAMLSYQMSSEEKLEFLDRIGCSDPFVQYPDEIELLKQEIRNNG